MDLNSVQFWGVEVKVGETVEVDPTKFYHCIHISQVALGEGQKGKASEPVVLYLTVDDQKFVLGTLSREKFPQLSLELVLEKKFELSHNSKHACVYFCGYSVDVKGGNSEEDDIEDFSETDSEDDLALMDKDNGKPITKLEEAKVLDSGKGVTQGGTSAKQVKIVNPKIDEEEESDDGSNNDSSDDDELESSDEMDVHSDGDEESGSDEDEETAPKKVDLGKKRPKGSATKTPVPTKKAKNATPEKTDGKNNVHAATPHPMKKGGKTPHSGGQFSFNSRSKSFISKGGQQQHNKAKHGGH